MRIAEYNRLAGKLIYRDATQEEMEAHIKIDEEEKTPTPEERIAALEEQLAAAKILLGVE
jgi:hypothetical protein